MITVKSGDTVFSVVGFDAEQSENLRLRTELMIEIEAILNARKMTQVEAAALFGVSQPRVSNLL